MYKPSLIPALLYQAQQGRCFHCLEPMQARAWTANRWSKGWTQDHVIPKSLGGGRHRNIVLAHHLCNVHRGAAPLSPVELARARLVIAAVYCYLAKHFPKPPVLRHYRPPRTGSPADLVAAVRAAIVA